MARPARVFIRARNPCFLFRLRVFGWNVRFVTGTSQHRSPRHQLGETIVPLGVCGVPMEYSRAAFLLFKAAFLSFPQTANKVCFCILTASSPSLG